MDQTPKAQGQEDELFEVEEAGSGWKIGLLAFLSTLSGANEAKGDVSKFSLQGEERPRIEQRANKPKASAGRGRGPNPKVPKLRVLGWLSIITLIPDAMEAIEVKQRANENGLRFEDQLYIEDLMRNTREGNPGAPWGTFPGEG